MSDLQELHALQEVPVPVPVRRTRPKTLLLTFLLGVVCTIALTIAVLSVFDIHGTISWPAGRIEIGQNAAPHVIVRHETK